MEPLLKFPRTPHIEGSRLQPGDHDLAQVPASALAGEHTIVEEKLDGANSGISFDSGLNILLQSRGHYLAGGPRERQFALFKTWAQTKKNEFRAILGRRYVMYGEWLYAKHTVFYDRLPHYFLEFDIFDRETGNFLDTASRRGLLNGSSIRSVPILHEGRIGSLRKLTELLRYSLYKSENWLSRLDNAARQNGQDPVRVRSQTDMSDLAEGLYIKTEEPGRVTGRFKFVRHGFSQALNDSGEHWMNRPILPNGLSNDADIFL